MATDPFQTASPKGEFRGSKDGLQPDALMGPSNGEAPLGTGDPPSPHVGFISSLLSQIRRRVT